MTNQKNLFESKIFGFNVWKWHFMSLRHCLGKFPKFKPPNFLSAFSPILLSRLPPFSNRPIHHPSLRLTKKERARRIFQNILSEGREEEEEREDKRASSAQSPLPPTICVARCLLRAFFHRWPFLWGKWDDIIRGADCRSLFAYKRGVTIRRPNGQWA